MLYLIATPIGNMNDITYRAVETLKQVDWIAAEDTRHSARLLQHYDIKTPTFSLHDHNETARIDKIVAILAEGKSIGLISDAGTPLISDPGFKLVRAVREKGFAVTAIPGPCAAIAGLITSGLPTDHFIFEGFLPAKSAALKDCLENIKNETRTVIFYESVHRIVKTVEMMQAVLGGDRQVTIARELTKTFETIKQDTLDNLNQWIMNPEQQKGEFVIVVAGAPAQTVEMADVQRLLSGLLDELPLKKAVALTSDLMKVNKNSVYDLALSLKSAKIANKNN